MFIIFILNIFHLLNNSYILVKLHSEIFSKFINIFKMNVNLLIIINII